MISTGQKLVLDRANIFVRLFPNRYDLSKKLTDNNQWKLVADVATLVRLNRIRLVLGETRWRRDAEISGTDWPLPCFLRVQWRHLVHSPASHRLSTPWPFLSSPDNSTINTG
ncbi:hypothetical protein T4D_4973 [Trichinella pseudospiralis]|uniref:Uncharacterized protein n=1 Tax=Trichinella pseudospiralis TaxID=6337 RepID=A0A0V1FBI9_TRIPS|nr:hypothetical protein T4D_4973 [Trichinella pseudospiralis]